MEGKEWRAALDAREKIEEMQVVDTELVNEVCYNPLLVERISSIMSARIPKTKTKAMPDSELIELAFGKGASNPGASFKILCARFTGYLDVMESLAMDGHPGVRKAVCNNKNVTPEVLRMLGTDENESIIQCVVTNKKTPADTLDILSDHPNRFVRGAVAVHKHTPREVLLRIAEEDTSQYNRDKAKESLKERID